ncbi:hypothetical protein [Cucumibacter marinus]|uniref:hypothetical protein n=1 Tax=Cucumibacter marinus TaxID=1121252 RepID=UPI0004292C5C|nr:hypothetical protein [Cucumibacter marinus]
MAKKKFLALYIGTAEATAKAAAETGSAADIEARNRAGMEAWGRWMEDHMDAIADIGGPLGKTRKVGPDGISTIVNDNTGYVIVWANSHEEAAEMFRNHPHFAIFPGDSVEVMECPPIPEM